MDRRSRYAVVLAAGLAATLLLRSTPSTNAQGPSSGQSASGPALILIAEPVNNFTKVGVSPEVVARLAAPTATINVTFTGFTAAAQAAFQHGVDLWEAQISSTVPILVDATFEPLETNVLGSAGSTFVFRDFTNAPITNTWYSSAQANALAGVDLKPGTHDIDASFNSTFSNWFFGTDGNTPAGQFDFVSVVMHEIGHGLGFSGSMNVSGGQGSWGISGFPEVYDRFAQNGSMQGLIDTSLFSNPSTALAAQLTSNNLFWGGSNGVSANGGTPPKLYAPSTWAGGSSFSHLDDATFPTGNPNSLMTHALGMAEAIHDPGSIVRGIFKDTGWPQACSFSLSPTTQTFGPAGGTGTVAVTGTSGCSRTATSDASWLTITSGSSGTGSGSVGFSVASFSGTGSRIGTLTIGDRTFTVTQYAILLTLDRQTLRFGGIKTGVALTLVTAPQEITISQSGSGTVSWTAADNQPWLEVSPASGAGAGRFNVTVVDASSLPSSGTVTGTVTISNSAGANSPELQVTLTLNPGGTTTAPFGAFDTPVNNVTVQGSIAVTGWALDDIGIDRVEIWRDPRAGETTYFEPGHLGHGKVFIGNGTFIEGTRPDVEGLYPTSPLAYWSGWGYLMLTRGSPWDGQGPFTVYAFAFDKEGKSTTLGTKTIAIDNATATKPFGAIDTPPQGATISGGAYVNFGWALTPQPKLVPQGSTGVQVAIDGVFIGSPACFSPRVDITAGFPGFANTPEAVRCLIFDTTQYANGLHNIGWLVTDDAGAQDGVGSRFFRILNTGSSLTTEVRGTSVAAGGQAPRTLAGAHTVFGQLGRSTTGLAGLADHGQPVRVARGAATGIAAADAVWPGMDGVRRIRIPELQRIEVHLAGEGPVSGYHVVGDELRRLPVGSTLDTTRGVFYWMPGPGFLGTYDLRFVRASAEQVRVQVEIVPAQADQITPRMAVDTPAWGSEVTQPFIVAGWAIDRAAWWGTGVDTLHVWAYPNPGSGAAPIFLGVAAYGGQRPDVGALFGAAFTPSGYGLTVDGLAPGEYDLVVFAHSAVTGTFNNAQLVRVTIR
jgi:hypothetical protein